MKLYNSPNGNGGNVNMNPPGSAYASQYNHNTDLLLAKMTDQVIFDAQPRQYFDLKMLEIGGSEIINSDEWNYKEMGYQRVPLIASTGASAATYPASQTFSITDIGTAATDMLLSYPNNTKGNITKVDVSTGEITVTPMTGQTLPAVSAGDIFSFGTVVESDGTQGFANNFRADTIERQNYVQLFSQAIEYDRVELIKYQRSGSVKGFLSAEKKAFMDQYRLSMSNAFWNGEKGEITTANGKKAKTMGGVYPTMVEAGAYTTVTPIATVGDALEDAVNNTEYGDYGDIRFLFACNRLIRAVSKHFKDDKTRYTPDNMTAKLMLKEIDLGSTRVVLVPMERLRDRASFPASFANRMFLINPNTIKMKKLYESGSGETLGRAQGVATTTQYFWVDSSMTIQFNNPLGNGTIDVTGI